VLDRVVQRDDVEARGGKIEVFDPPREDAQAALARALCGVVRDLHALHVPTGVLRFHEEVAERAAHVEEPALAAVTVLDRLDAIAEGAAIHIRVEEVVRVAALGILGRVVVGVIQGRGRGGPRGLTHETAVIALHDDASVDLEHRPGATVRAERARVRDFRRARRRANNGFDVADADVRERAHGRTVERAALSLDP